MSRRTLLGLGLLLLTAAPAAPAREPGEDRPRLDPFARPRLAALPGAPDAGKEALPDPWLPVLRGTLVAEGEGSLANLGGVVLKVGEAYQGFRLLEVRRFEATFEREGERVVLQVSGEDLPDAETLP